VVSPSNEKAEEAPVKKEIEAKFDAVFSAHEKRVQGAQAAEVVRKTQESEFRDRFIKHRADIIKPAMEQTADYLRSRGVLTTRITESDESINDRERPQTQITFTLMEDGGKHGFSHDRPSFSFICDKHKKTVSMHKSTIGPGHGGQSGGVGDVELDSLTGDLVQEKLLELIREVFR
jgi:hypothetical protein